MSGQPARPRADAQRNRSKLLVAARDAFAAGNGDITFDSLARQAGVGIGTLYRNFPNRQELVEAVYRAELVELVAEADGALDAGPADAALRRWIDRYAGFVATKQGMAEAFQQAIATGAIAAGETRAQVRGAVARFLARGAIDGSLRADLDPDDVTVALVGAFLGALRLAADDAQRARVLDLIVEGLRPR